MDASAPKFLFSFLFTSTLVVCSSGKITNRHQVPKTVQHDVNLSTTTPATTTPATVTVPPYTSTPGVVTIPSATPVSVTPSTPSTPVTTPAVAPPAATNTAAVPGQSWCVAKTGAPEKSLQAALDYACGTGKADCSAIQQGASCYNPNSLQSHASYAFNSYYQLNPVATSCDFGGTAVVTTTNPSSGTCVFTASSSSTPPTTVTPTTTTPSPTPITNTPSPTPVTYTPTTPAPTTASSNGAVPAGSSSGTPPNILNASNPTFGGAATGFGDSPPAVNMTSSVSLSISLQPFIGLILVVTSVIIGEMVLDI